MIGVIILLTVFGVGMLGAVAVLVHVVCGLVRMHRDDRKGGTP